ncbi:hypothetical protein PHISCL_05991 [Aspergillus sclerotialis]|uniref:Uncharacterized protein n=1 Tax=Aspergillus sclerotialis TaxID=2070753 RepID=A0A3A2ZX83_9EURO|nr:hypothetical protein PHISCL_05991 [Aspergillus sclerotialis]
MALAELVISQTLQGFQKFQLKTAMDATRETLLQKAESGDLSAVKEFVNDKFTQMLGRVAPGATLLWQERTPDDPLERSKHAQVTFAGKVVLCAELSATQQLVHLKEIVTQRTLTDYRARKS